MIVLSTIILWGIAIALLIPSTVFFIECLAACLPIPPPIAQTEARRPKIAVLIPAHNEATVLEKTLGTILPQLQDNDRLIVIADNCEDRTAEIARHLGATVIERQNLQQRGKGYAIDYGLSFLEAEPPDVVISLDADILVEQGTIEQLARQADRLGKPVQAIYVMEQPPNPTARDTLSALAFSIKNQVRATGLSRLNLPCLLAGAGIAFPWPILQKVSVASSNLVEDMQLGIDLALVGFPPVLCPQAKIVGILPQREQAAKTQRTRWEHGHLQTLFTQVPRLLKATIGQRRIELLGLALELSIPPLSFLVMLWVTALVIALLAGILIKIWFPVFLIILAGLLLFIAVLMAWYTYGRPTISGKALLSIPFYLLWKIPLYVAFLFRSEKQWIRTERDIS